MPYSVGLGLLPAAVYLPRAMGELPVGGRDSGQGRGLVSVSSNTRTGTTARVVLKADCWLPHEERDVTMMLQESGEISMCQARFRRIRTGLARWIAVDGRLVLDTYCGM